MPTDWDRRHVAKRLGNELATARQKAREAGLPAEQADIAAGVGITREAYSAYERGVAIPPLDRLIPIAVLLGVSVLFLLAVLEPDARTAKSIRAAAAKGRAARGR